MGTRKKPTDCANECSGNVYIERMTLSQHIGHRFEWLAVSQRNGTHHLDVVRYVKLEVNAPESTSKDTKQRPKYDRVRRKEGMAKR